MLWITPHVLSAEDRFVRLQNTDYELALKAAWYDKLVTDRPSEGASETFEFLLTTASIVDLPKGQMVYDELFTKAFSVAARDRGKGLFIPKQKWMDDQFGFAGEWASQMGANIALDPQYLAIELILKAAKTPDLVKCYDGGAFLRNNHPINPAAPVATEIYSNLITNVNQLDATLGSAKPFLSTATFALADAYVRSFKMPNGRNRNLQPAFLVHGPKLRKTALEVTGAKFIDATENVLTTYQIEPLCINEIEGLSWALAMTNVGSQLKPIVYMRRQPFAMTSYDGLTQATLNHMRQLEWNVEGRAEAFFTHPYQWVWFDCDTA